MSDADLLQSYARDGSSAAFSTLVERYLDLVYSVARRHVRSSALAEEVAQSVFIELSRRAPRLEPGTPLVAWLHVVSRHAALNVVRGESRRRLREAAAAEIAHGEFAESARMKSDVPPWSAVEPLLDEAVESLAEPDRTAILLRYFQNKNHREIGAVLGTSDDAAQKRVSRALDQLRAFLLRRGIAVTASGLATDLSAHAIQSAPAQLGPTIAAAGLGAAPPAAAAASATVLTMTLLEKTLLSAGLILAVGGALFEANTVHAQRRAADEVRQQIDTIAAQVRQSQTARDAALREVADTRTRLAQLAPGPNPADAATEATMTAWLARAARLKQLVRDRPELSIPEFDLLTSDQWLQASRELRTATEEDVRNALARLRQLAESSLLPKLQTALKAYLAAHDNSYPDDPAQLAPHFSPPAPVSVLARYKMALPDGAKPGAPLTAIELSSPIDPERDSTLKITTTTTSSRGGANPILEAAMRAFYTANNNSPPMTAEDLRPFLPPGVDPARFELKFAERR